MASQKPYMVIFKSHVPSSTIDTHISTVESKGGKIKQRFDSEIMKGFAATMPQDHAQELTALSEGGKHDEIDYVEADSEVKTQ